MNNISEKIIFIVDDDFFCRELYRTTLTGMGYKNVYIYDNGNDCIANLSMNPDLLFLDYNMEPMNGLDILKKVKETNSSTTVLLLSGCKDQNVINSALEYGALDYIIKNDNMVDSLQNTMKNRIQFQNSSL